MDEVCTACLCRGRNLFSIEGSKFYDLFTQIIKEISMKEDMYSICLHVCWECKAVLNRFLKFKKQVQKCYMELVDHIQKKIPDTNLIQKAPHLQSYIIESTTYPDIPVPIKIENVAIKEEYDDTQYELDNSVNDLVLDVEQNKNIKCKMGKKRKRQRPATGSVGSPKRKSSRPLADTSSIDEEDNSCLHLSESDCDFKAVKPKRELDHESDQDDWTTSDEMGNNTSIYEEDMTLAELQRTNICDGENRYDVSTLRVLRSASCVLVESGGSELSSSQSSKQSRAVSTLKWSNKPPNRVYNINTYTSASKLTEDDMKDPLSIWTKLFDDEMFRQISTWTNEKIETKVDTTELKAFVGLLLYSAVMKSTNRRASSLFIDNSTDGEIFRSCMSGHRFSDLLMGLQIDSPDDQTEVLDDSSALSSIFNKFIHNSQQVYELSECVTIDEMLVKFYGKSDITIRIKKKPGQHALVIRALCDARNGYFYNGHLYTGSDGVEFNTQDKKLLVPTQCVLRLVEPIEGTNRNVTADSRFSSLELIDVLTKRKLTYVGTINKNEDGIHKDLTKLYKREIQSTMFRFTDEMTLCSYVPLKNRNIILVSSMHHDNEINEITKEPGIFLYYQATKGGVDEADRICSIYSTNRRTKRWTLALFFRMLDLCGMNAHILYNMHQPNIEREDFLISLARALVLPHIQRRAVAGLFSEDVKLEIKRVLDRIREQIVANEGHAIHRAPSNDDDAIIIQ